MRGSRTAICHFRNPTPTKESPHMKKHDKSESKKLTLSKTTITSLTARTGVKAGGCSKNWTKKNPQL